MYHNLSRHLQLEASRPLKVLLAVCILTVSAKITVPFYPVPMTLHVAAVMLLAGLGGLRFGATSVAAYLAIGAAGLPVFTGTPEKGIGLVYLAGPTGGYLAGFLVAALCIGWAVDRFGNRAVWLAMPASLLVIYALGLMWLTNFVPHDQLYSLGVAPFLFGDLLKVAIAAILSALAPTALKNWIKA